MRPGSQQMVHRFIDALGSNRFEEAKALMAESALWWVANNPTADGSEDYTGAAAPRDAMFARLEQVFGATGGLNLVVRHIIGDGDRLAVELESRAAFSGGLVYNNRYTWVFEIAGGRISALREYLDSKYLDGFMTTLHAARSAAGKEEVAP